MEIMQERVYATRIGSVDELKQRIPEEWRGINDWVTALWYSGVHVFKPVLLLKDEHSVWQMDPTWTQNFTTVNVSDALTKKYRSINQPIKKK